MSKNHRNIVVLVVMFCVFYDVLRKAKHPANDVYCPSPARVLQVKYNKIKIKIKISFFGRKMKDKLSPFVNYISKSYKVGLTFSNPVPTVLPSSSLFFDAAVELTSIFFFVPMSFEIPVHL